jgi:hypothetical protein
MARLEYVTPDTLRHTFASVAGDLGFSELTIAALLGHSARGVTPRFISISTRRCGSRLTELRTRWRTSSTAGRRSRDRNGADRDNPKKMMSARPRQRHSKRKRIEPDA